MAKKNTTHFKSWRLNVTVLYFGEINVNRYRYNILEMLKHLATIYKLDYSISVEHQFFSEIDLTIINAEHYKADLIYFRSNNNSKLVRKEFRTVIDNVFRITPSPFLDGVEVLTQLYKVLPNYPFPSDFYRPLNYPYIEFYKDSKMTLYIYTDEVMKIAETRQDFRLN